MAAVCSSLVDFAEWEPLYEAIVAEFGFSRAEDEAARDELARLLLARRAPAGARDPLDVARERIAGRPAVVVGAGRIVDPEALPGGSRVVADSAVTMFVAGGGLPDMVVTDLDGDPPLLVALAPKGVVLAVHAHGDNRDALATWVPRLRGPILGTTQAAPVPPLVNCGGFTDGDRACFLAACLGATEVRLAGFDFERAESDRKRAKLAWARRLLAKLDVPVVETGL